MDAFALEAQGLVKEFAGFRAVDGVDLRVRAGSIHALVGPNGAGKTTLFNLLCGFLKPTAGRIVIGQRDVTRLPPERIARLGVGRSFQITSLFEQLTALEHVQLALQSGSERAYHFWASERVLDGYQPRALEILDQVEMADLAQRPAQSLPYGQKRALEVALVLALGPTLLLLDEPTAGMGMEDIARVTRLIRAASAGRTVVLVEHNMGIVAELADTVTVLQHGKVLAEGPYERVRLDPLVIEAYLGQVETRAA